MRIGVISIIIEKDRSVAKEINELLSSFGDIIIGRMGIPMKEEQIFVITVIIKAPLETISALSGKIGKMKGVKIKTATSNLETK